MVSLFAHLKKVFDACRKMGEWEARDGGRVLVSGTPELRRASIRSLLEQGLAFTPAVREAWTVTFVLVSDTMKTAAHAA